MIIYFFFIRCIRSDEGVEYHNHASSKKSMNIKLKDERYVNYNSWDMKYIPNISSNN